jgi:hypothetical protein
VGISQGFVLCTNWEKLFEGANFVWLPSAASMLHAKIPAGDVPIRCHIIASHFLLSSSGSVCGPYQEALIYF